MTRSDLASRILLVADRRDTVAVCDDPAPKVRRYRLARLQLNERPAASRAARHARVKRIHD